ncbi:hypothetical protein B0H63DRAFT_473829 [Podospora didyma]|uniref:Rhodopsin domain-containing protein n=1 Tax=Podospora didyma TaxID=330526 RepID=A0AAE0U025_9PEZI|nr:hypothetical protein B0H63DRAFT_473829 [Podospora didyma]
MSAELPPGMDLSMIPLAANPSGAPPDFDHGPSLEPVVLGTGITFIIISSLMLMLRFYTGLKKSRRLFADDWLCLVGEIVGIVQWAVLYTILHNGLSRHTWDTRVSAITPYVLKLQLGNQMLAAVTHFCVKASLAFFFMRVFGTLNWVRIVCYFLLVLTFASYLSYEIVVIIYCIPRAGEEWGPVSLARCTTSAPSTIAVGVCSVVADLIIFVLPFPIIAGLSLNSQRKKGLAVVFLVGLLVVITSVVGLAYRIIVSYESTNDPLWHGGNVAITAYMEIFGTVIVACSPSLSSFWVNIFMQTQLYSSIHSRLFSSGRSTRPSAAASGRDYPSAASANKGHAGSSAYSLPSKRPHTGQTNASSKELVTEDLPLSAIQKSTIIVQKTSQDSSPEPVKENGRWELRNTSKGW